jgi:hypothetical protein
MLRYRISLLSMLTYVIPQHGHKRRHFKKFHTSAWTQNKAC